MKTYGMFLNGKLIAKYHYFKNAKKAFNKLVMKSEQRGKDFDDIIVIESNKGVILKY